MADRHSATVIAGGGVLVAASAALVPISLSEIGQAHHLWSNSWFELGLVLGAIGIAIAAFGMYLHFRDRGKEQPTLPPGSRTGYRVSGHGKVWSERTRMRNQDLAFDVRDSGQLHDRHSDIA